MNRYNPQKHHRRSIRLQGYDYSQEGLYFITICCQDRAHLFGKVEESEMILNAFGKIAWDEWFATEKVRKNCKIHESIVMPNHIHGIIEILYKKEKSAEGELKFAPISPSEIGEFKSPSQTIGSIIRGFKIATIKKIKDYILENNSRGELQFAPTEFAPTELQFAPTTKKIIELNFKIWQSNYYEHIIRNEQSYHRISEYIINNPKKWNEDKFYK